MAKTLMFLGKLLHVECGEDRCADCDRQDYDENDRMCCTIFGGRLRPTKEVEEYYRLRDCLRSELPDAKNCK